MDDKLNKFLDSKISFYITFIGGIVGFITAFMMVKIDVAVLSEKMDAFVKMRESNIITMSVKEKKYDMCCTNVTTLNALHGLTTNF